MRTQLEAQAVPGSLVLQRGSLAGENVTGPVKVATQAKDVSFDGFTDAVEIAVDRGDIQLKPVHLPLSKINAQTRSGDIEITLPERASVAVTATTNHGEIANDFDSTLKQENHEHGARLEGSVGSGPELTLRTDHGDIALKKTGNESSATEESGSGPKPPRSAPESEI
ncbi:MAG: DUF4097 family beta strand repeat protein [Acidobacteriaceae bacterium]|nr:DUF4097 family beta strand repeat protein [Acidobacteriaceae bacterium]